MKLKELMRNTQYWFTKLNSTENQLVAEHNSMWQLMAKVWLKCKDITPKPTITNSFLQHIIGEYADEYPSIYELILILMAVMPGTGLLEQSLTKLWKMCYKGRCGTSFDMLEVLYPIPTVNQRGWRVMEENKRVLSKKVITFL